MIFLPFIGLPSLIAAIAAGVAIGAFIVWIVKLTITALSNKLKSLFAKKNLSKAAVGDIQKIVNSCQNQSSMDELEQLANQGYTHVIAGVDNNGQVSDIELTKDELRGSDIQVSNFINRTGEGMVVVNA